MSNQRKPSDMRKLTPEQQEELRQRWLNRRDIRAANRRLAVLVLSWVIDKSLSEEEFMNRFEAGGHAGEYLENPADSRNDSYAQRNTTRYDATGDQPIYHSRRNNSAEGI